MSAPFRQAESEGSAQLTTAYIATVTEMVMASAVQR